MPSFSAKPVGRFCLLFVGMLAVGACNDEPGPGGSDDPDRELDAIPESDSADESAPEIETLPPSDDALARRAALAIRLNVCWGDSLADFMGDLRGPLIPGTAEAAWMARVEGCQRTAPTCAALEECSATVLPLEPRRTGRSCTGDEADPPTCSAEGLVYCVEGQEVVEACDGGRQCQAGENGMPRATCFYPDLDCTPHGDGGEDQYCAGNRIVRCHPRTGKVLTYSECDTYALAARCDPNGGGGDSARCALPPSVAECDPDADPARCSTAQIAQACVAGKWIRFDCGTFLGARCEILPGSGRARCRVGSTAPGATASP